MLRSRGTFEKVPPVCRAGFWGEHREERRRGSFRMADDLLKGVEFL